MRAHLLHGFNVSDGGADTVLGLMPFLEQRGIRPVDHDYGWTGLIDLRFRNRRVVDELIEKVHPGDTLVGHSNGALICWQVACRLIEEAPGFPVQVVAIQPALRRDTYWPGMIPVLSLWNRGDWAVAFGRIWSRLATAATWRRHGWGAAGRRGFTQDAPNLTQWRTDDTAWNVPVSGHSRVFDKPWIGYWGPHVARWVAEHGQ